MINVCFNCGQYHADKIIDPEGPYAICPACGYKHAFRQLPLLMLAGASGVGKSTVGWHLAGRVKEAIVLDADILWRPEFNKPEDIRINRWLQESGGEIEPRIALLNTTGVAVEQTARQVALWISECIKD